MRRFVLIVVAAVSLVLPTGAHAAYPGSNGKLAFVRDSQIWTMNADGSGAAQLTTGSTTAAPPQWSPDGTKIAYARSCGLGCNREVRVMNADGSGDGHVYGGPGVAEAYSPTWSPDASTIALIRVGSAGRPCICTTYNIDIANPDGSNRHTVYTVTDP